jgi:RHS repeat-associated protein
MRARYFDPTTGGFLSEDPIGHRGGINFYRLFGIILST